jgi:hypothetical protein
MEILLNRWRGTGNIYKGITGTMLYALYFGLLVGILSQWYYGILAIALFLFGESFAFGKWVGYLVDYEDEHTPEYDNKVGKSFPYIHYIADAIVKEKENYKKYCQVALTIRGFIWWTPLLILLGSIDLISWYQVVISSIVLAVGFPFACWIGRNWKLEYKAKYLLLKRGWENQEVVYGLIQFLAISLPVLLHTTLK